MREESIRGAGIMTWEDIEWFLESKVGIERNLLDSWLDSLDEESERLIVVLAGCYLLFGSGPDSLENISAMINSEIEKFLECEVNEIDDGFLH